MIRQYKELCKEYKCKAKIYQMAGGMKNIGTPDLLVLFTNTVSHKMIRRSLDQTKGHTSSMNALRSILKEHIGEDLYV